jgi:hypothetical protein
MPLDTSPIKSPALASCMASVIARAIAIAREPFSEAPFRRRWRHDPLCRSDVPRAHRTNLHADAPTTALARLERKRGTCILSPGRFYI